jgi:hypothetical protein
VREHSAIEVDEHVRARSHLERMSSDEIAGAVPSGMQSCDGCGAKLRAVIQNGRPSVLRTERQGAGSVVRCSADSAS